jgi:hypothetical protein
MVRYGSWAVDLINHTSEFISVALTAGMNFAVAPKDNLREITAVLRMTFRLIKIFGNISRKRGRDNV